MPSISLIFLWKELTGGVANVLEEKSQRERRGERREERGGLALHCTKNPIYVFPEMKPRGLVPISYIITSVSDLYIPRIGLPIRLQQNRQANPGILQIAKRYLNVETGRQNIM